ncbi:receptor-like protein kinase [Dorcoceras hygrometricum]|uniref:Receptor-like protein kinase n=1 Tax=Dorcoceras hygrometricum TaxID=472368 RepID=A0A2Z7AKA0_9LAMI|nr:receptor-like protein kinase [Dorcoceras hygrometricum]
MGPISYIGPKTSRAARDRPELNPRRNQPSRHRRSIAGAAAATTKIVRRKATHGRDKHGAPCAIVRQQVARTSGDNRPAIIARPASSIAQTAPTTCISGRPPCFRSRGQHSHMADNASIQQRATVRPPRSNRAANAQTACQRVASNARPAVQHWSAIARPTRGCLRTSARGGAPPCAAAPWPFPKILWIDPI